MSTRPELVRSLGRWSLAGLVLNGIIGSSVFFLPGPLADRLGWMSLAAWAIAAGCCAAMILCFAEVASRFSGAGGAYLFTRTAFGSFTGLQVGWLSYFVRAITAAVQANLFSTYLAEFWPWAATRLGGIAATTLFIGVLAAANMRSVVSGARLSNGFALVKITPLLVFGVLGLMWVTAGKAVPAPLPSDPSLSGWLGVLLLLMFAYGGFESAVIPLGEATNPRRDAPIALLGGLGLAALVYTLAQITVLATLTEPAASTRPLADSARAMLGNTGATIVTLAALISVYGWLASNLLTVPRLSMAMAEQGDFPAFFARVHPAYRTPHLSILFFAAISWTLANQAGLLQNLSLAAVSRLFTYGLVCAAVPVLRRRDRLGTSEISPALFRAPWGNVLAVFSVLVSITLASRMNLREAVSLAITVGLATMYWFFARRKRGVERARS
jgi:basic amino acid/polyamine antiporter, APA family